MRIYNPSSYNDSAEPRFVKPQRWEYLVDYFSGIDHPFMKEYGDNGWDLVSVARINKRTVFYFKRPL